MEEGELMEEGEMMEVTEVMEVTDSDYTTKPQSSRQYSIGTKTEI